VEIGARIRSVREAKGLSQGDLERVTGLLRSHLSRIEHGHTIPSLANVERIAAAFGMRLDEIFNEDVPPLKPLEQLRPDGEGGEYRFLSQLRCLIGRISEADRRLFLDFARMLARPGRQRAPVEGRRRGRPRKHFAASTGGALQAKPSSGPEPSPPLLSIDAKLSN